MENNHKDTERNNPTTPAPQEDNTKKRIEEKETDRTRNPEERNDDGQRREDTQRRPNEDQNRKTL